MHSRLGWNPILGKIGERLSQREEIQEAWHNCSRVVPIDRFEGAKSLDRAIEGAKSLDRKSAARRRGWSQ